MSTRDRGVTPGLPEVERVVVRRRGSGLVPTIVSEKPEPKSEPGTFPEPGAIEELFKEARRNRA